MRGAAALYIGVTLGIYFTVLRHLWQPQGAQWLADSGLHYLVPVLYLGWWLCGMSHGALRWSDLLRWLAFPLAYLAWVLLRGAWVGEYPYPFLDLNLHDAVVVACNVVGMCGVFIVAGAGLLLIDRMLGRFAAVEPT